MKIVKYISKSNPQRIYFYPEEYAKEASRLIKMLGELKEPLKLLQMDNEYPVLKDLRIHTRAHLLVNPSYSEKRVLESQDELFIRVCNKLVADNFVRKSTKGERAEKMEEPEEIYNKADYARNRTFKGA